MLCVLMVGCGGATDSTGGDGGNDCVPDETKDCVCTDGGIGEQTCSAAGDSYSACLCGDGNDKGGLSETEIDELCLAATNAPENCIADFATHEDCKASFYEDESAKICTAQLRELYDCVMEGGFECQEGDDEGRWNWSPANECYEQAKARGQCVELARNDQIDQVCLAIAEGGAGCTDLVHPDDCKEEMSFSYSCWLEFNTMFDCVGDAGWKCNQDGSGFGPANDCQAELEEWESCEDSSRWEF
jgi:hypothetical protein